MTSTRSGTGQRILQAIGLALLSFVVAAPGSAGAQPAPEPAPSTQPVDAAAERTRPFPSDPPPVGSAMEMTEEIPAEEWDEVAEFTKQHSPKRWQYFLDLPEDNRERVRRAMYWRFLQVERLREQQPELFELQMQRLVIEDEIFPLAWKIRRSDGADSDELQPVLDELRKHLTALVEVGLKERQIRLERLKDRVAMEEEQISLDRARKEQNVEAQMQEILRRRRGPWPWPGGDGTRPGDRRGESSLGAPSGP